MLRRIGIWAGVVWALAVITIVPAARLFDHYLQTPVKPDSESVVVSIPTGANPAKVAKILREKGVIGRPRLFRLATRIRGLDRKLKSGEYNLSAALSPAQIMSVLTAGTPFQYRVTLQEGLTMAQIAAKLEKAGLVKADPFLTAATDSGLVISLGIPALTVEGYLFPDTYHFPRGMTASEIIKRMVGRFREVMALIRATKPGTTDLTEHQSVILASLVEAETKAASERPVVAGVFVNRLKKRMLLQCDPTVVYGIKNFKGRIRKRHLTDPHPYNTYVHPGLPPGPIGNPGRSALSAALNPEKTKYLYFVAKNDGTHYFSKNYAQHQKAVNKYQR